MGDTSRRGCLTPAFSGAPQVAVNATSPLHSRGSPNNAGQKQNWTVHPCLLRGPKEAGKATSPLHLEDPQTMGDKFGSGYLTIGFSRPKRGRKWYITPAFSGNSKQWGTKSEVAASNLPSRGPQIWRKCYVTPAISGIPEQRGTTAELAASPLPSRGPKRGRKCYIGPPRRKGANSALASHFSGMPRMQGLHSIFGLFWTPKKARLWQPIRILSPFVWGSPTMQWCTSRWKCYITPAFTGIRK